uniref:Uncharacterized protein n=1 Tax=Zea mays TaxID=4577 RepID=B4FNJ2_MAIZE|nr:unknown [Zea mays]ACR37119.1 unknown [Zea mays]ACR37436.1 unknown [Zea mays]
MWPNTINVPIVPRSNHHACEALLLSRLVSGGMGPNRKEQELWGARTALRS